MKMNYGILSTTIIQLLNDTISRKAVDTINNNPYVLNYKSGCVQE